MSHTKRRETKQEPSRARSGHQISSCLVPSTSCATSCQVALYYASKFQQDSIELGIAQNMKELLLLVWKGRQATATFAAFFGTGTTNGKSITCSSKLQPAAAAGGGWESGRKEWWKEWRKIPPCAIRDNLSSLMPTPGYPGGILRHRYKRKMYWETIQRGK